MTDDAEPPRRRRVTAAVTLGLAFGLVVGSGLAIGVGGLELRIPGGLHTILRPTDDGDARPASLVETLASGSVASSSETRVALAGSMARVDPDPSGRSGWAKLKADVSEQLARAAERDAALSRAKSKLADAQRAHASARDEQRAAARELGLQEARGRPRSPALRQAKERFDAALEQVKAARADLATANGELERSRLLVAAGPTVSTERLGETSVAPEQESSEPADGPQASDMPVPAAGAPAEDRRPVPGRRRVGLPPMRIALSAEDAAAVRRDLQTGLATGAPFSVVLPVATGNVDTVYDWFRCDLAQTHPMAAELSKRHPTIRSLHGSVSGLGAYRVAVTLSRDRLHLFTTGPTGTVYFDPEELFPLATPTRQPCCVITNGFANPPKTPTPLIATACAPPKPRPKGAQIGTLGEREDAASTLVIYRLALTCGNEFVARAHEGLDGDPKTHALAVMVRILTRLNLVYASELGIRFQLVPRTEDLIFVQRASDPFAGLTGTQPILDRTQETIDRVVGTDGYDLGHSLLHRATPPFAPSAANAGFGNDQLKASGTTGNAGAYAVEYLAHEMGHQLGATHTFSGSMGECTDAARAAETAVEPGSGTTLMSYAGLCKADDAQPNANPYFHSVSISQIQEFLGQNPGIGAKPARPREPPRLDLGEWSMLVPCGTPFRLDASIAEGTPGTTTYSWEQLDAAGGADPRVYGPLYRTRVPSLSTYSDRTAPIDVDRTLWFRLTVRDNHPAGGRTASADVAVSTWRRAGPYRVVLPNAANRYTAGAELEVKWDPAGTNTEPIGVSRVDVLLSLDGGRTYRQDLPGWSDLENDGSATLTLPTDVDSDRARVMIRPRDAIFFALSRGTFRIDPLPSLPDR